MSWTWVCVLALLGAGACRAEAEGEAWELQQLLRRLDVDGVAVPLPGDARATLSAADLAHGVLNFRLQLPDAETDAGLDGEGRGKKKKIKKIAAPIIALLLIKAITLIPLILGVLGIKTWNALQLSFITFLTSFGLSVYELLKKFASDHPTPIITHIAHDHHHDHHDHHWQKRSVDGMKMAYSAYN